VYAVGLIVLFKRFYDEKYKGTESKKPQISEAKQEAKKEPPAKHESKKEK
jgi:hypothetical protein